MSTPTLISSPPLPLTSPMTDHIKTRKPPLKKRHTKPCRYFQHSSCPKTSEECDFAHVLGPTSPLPPSQTPCKYFLSGTCNNGVWCRFVHPVNAQREDLSAFSVRYPYKHMSEGPTMMYPAYTPLPISPYQPFYTVSARPPQWSAPLYYPSPSDASFFLPQPVVSPPSSNSEEHTDDEKNGRDYSNPINLTANSVVVSPTVQRPETPPHPSQESSRSPTRSVKYKTKWCKFVQSGRICPSGTACTFIHEEDNMTRSMLIGDKGIKHRLPAKPLSPKEQEMKRGHFPVSWRIIGGGVRVGSNNGNVALAYEDIDDLYSDNMTEEDEFHYVETYQPKPMPYSSTIKLEFPAFEDRKSDLGSGNAVETPHIRVTPRVRATSIPNAPTVGNTQTEQTRFPAES